MTEATAVLALALSSLPAQAPQSRASLLTSGSLRVVATSQVGGKPKFSVVDGKGKVVVNSEASTEVLRIDAKSMKVEVWWKLDLVEEPSGLAFDPKTRRSYLPTAEFEPVVPPLVPSEPGAPRRRPTSKPGTFKILVVGT